MQKQPYRPPPARRRSPIAPQATPKPSPRATPGKLPFLFMLSGTAFFFYASYHGASAYYQLTRPQPQDQDGTTKRPNLTDVYNKTASEFDQEVDSTEYWFGIMRLRRKMVKQAKGHVLESAAGTGRNSEFYERSRIGSLLMVDKSEGMLGICRDKWDKVRPGESWAGKVRFWVGDLESPAAEEEVKPMVGEKRLDEGFDTVVQTMGLCSTDDPESLLRSLGKLVKKDGRILLLEHGKSYYEWLNRLLDQTAPQHAARHGCWWNRDIGAIVEKSGLEIVEISRPTHHFGTTWWVELRQPQNQDVTHDKSNMSSK